MCGCASRCSLSSCRRLLPFRRAVRRILLPRHRQYAMPVATNQLAADYAPPLPPAPAGAQAAPTTAAAHRAATAAVSGPRATRASGSALAHAQESTLSASLLAAVSRWQRQPAAAALDTLTTRAPLSVAAPRVKRDPPPAAIVCAQFGCIALSRRRRRRRHRRLCRLPPLRRPARLLLHPHATQPDGLVAPARILVGSAAISSSLAARLLHPAQTVTMAGPKEAARTQRAHRARAIPTMAG